MQSHRILGDRSLRIPFWTEVQGWCNPTTFSRTEITGSVLNWSSGMIQSHRILEYRSHRIRYEQTFKDDTILPHSWGPRPSDTFWTEVQGWCNPTTFTGAETFGYILNRSSKMMQSHHIHEDRSHRIYFGQMSQDDAIPLHSWGPKSPDHFRTNVQGWDNPTATSLLPLSRKVFLNNTKLVSKVFELNLRQRLHQHISNLLISTHILDLYGSFLYHILNVEVPYFYVLHLIMEHEVLCHLHAALVIA